MRVLFLLFALLPLAAMGMAKGPMAARYDGFKIYKVLVTHAQELQELKDIHKKYQFHPSRQLHFLKELAGNNQEYDIAIGPLLQPTIEKLFKYLDTKYKVVIEDLQEVIEMSPTNSVDEMDWNVYHSLDVIYNWVDKQCATHSYLRCSVIGHSYEGRPIKSVILSKRPGNKAIFLEGNMHAMEWISSATVTFIMNQLLNSNDPEWQRLTEEYDWIIVPMVNPDGFTYSHDVERLWRKNRRPNGFRNATGECYGVDMNRNFDNHWGLAGWNVDEPCDHWYAGAKANTEMEILHLQKFVNSFDDGYIRAYLAFHAYGQYVLLPYGHSNVVFPPNYEQMMRIATDFSDAAQSVFGKSFIAGASGLLNYPVSGSAKDWAYNVKKVPFTATIELRDKGTFGFFLPSNQIYEVGVETTAGLKALVNSAKKEGIFA